MVLYGAGVWVAQAMAVEYSDPDLDVIVESLGQGRIDSHM